MPYALVTSSTFQLGRDIACELASRRYDLVLLARSERILRDLAFDIRQQYDVEVVHLAIDLSHPEAAQQVSAFVRNRGIRLGILINNPGYGMWGSFSELNIAQQISMLRQNNEHVISLTYELLPILQSETQSYVLNIASLLAYGSLPYMSFYAASKAFIVSFSRSLSSELKKTNVSVTCISSEGLDRYFSVHGPSNTTRRPVKANVELDTRTIATHAVEALLSKKTEPVIGRLDRIIACANRLFPKFAVDRLILNIYKPNSHL